MCVGHLFHEVFWCPEASLRRTPFISSALCCQLLTTVILLSCECLPFLYLCVFTCGSMSLGLFIRGQGLIIDYAGSAATIVFNLTCDRCCTGGGALRVCVCCCLCVYVCVCLLSQRVIITGRLLPYWQMPNVLFCSAPG